MSLSLCYRSLFQEGDKFLVVDKAKEKKLPGTKDKPIYKGPFEVSSITDSHLVSIVNGKLCRYPIHLSRRYFCRDIEVRSNIYIYTSALRLLALRGLRSLRDRTRAYGPRVAVGMQVYTVAGVQVYIL